VTTLPPRKRDIAMVFQSYALYAHMSVRDNIGFGLKMGGAPKPQIADKVDEAAEILGIVELLDRKPRQLSGGQRQRVAMGRAIVREPAAFLMDEPLSNLDAKLRVEMRGEITSLQRRIGTPTLYVTHDQTEAMTMGDRVAILRDGVLEQLGTPAELYERPDNMFVASFIGSPAMNLIEAGCEVANGRPLLRIGGSELSVPDAVLARCAALGGYAGRGVCVGIRPEDFVSTAAAGQPATIEVAVTRAESLGSELFVYFQTVGTEASPGIVGDELGEAVETPALAREALTARLDRGASVEPGARAHLSIDTERLYFFDLDTGAALR
jgi:multiple sugar transport system ATP-binding protein